MKEFVEKLIERLEELKEESIDKWDGGASHKAYIKAIEIVNQMAEEYVPDTNVASKNCWILCSERLPKGEGYHKKIDGIDCYKHVLTTTTDCDVPICIGWYDEENETWFDLEGFVYYPVAWQALPKAYKQKENTPSKSSSFEEKPNFYSERFNKVQ